MGVRTWVVAVMLCGCGDGTSDAGDELDASSDDRADAPMPADSTYCSAHEWACEGLDCDLADDERAYVVALSNAAQELGLQSTIRIGRAAHEPIGGGIVIAYEVEVEWLLLPAQARWELDLVGAELEAQAHAELESYVGAEIADRALLEAAIAACNAVPVVDACDVAPWSLTFDFENGELQGFANEAISADNCLYQATEVTLDLRTAARRECVVYEPYDVCVPETG